MNMATGSGGGGTDDRPRKRKKFEVISLDYASRRKQQLRATSGDGGGAGGSAGSSGADYHNQVYKLTENIQLLDERIVHMERMLRKLLRLMRNAGTGGGSSGGQ